MLEALGHQFPTDWTERRKVLTNMPKSVERIFMKYSGEFEKYLDNLTELVYEYILKNRDQLSSLD